MNQRNCVTTLVVVTLVIMFSGARNCEVSHLETLLQFIFKLL